MIVNGNTYVYFETQFNYRNIVKMFIVRDCGSRYECLMDDGTWAKKDKKSTHGEIRDYKEGLVLPSDTLVDIANALAKMGIIPDQWKAKEEVLSATNRHLEDMRKLVFKETNQ